MLTAFFPAGHRYLTRKHPFEEMSKQMEGLLAGANDKLQAAGIREAGS